MRNLLKYLLTFTCLIAVQLVLAQAVVLKNTDVETYYEETLWGPEQQHYAHYFIRYGMATPTASGLEEKPAFGGTWAAGFTYKLKIIDVWDIGLDLAYENEWHRLRSSNQLRSLGNTLIVEDLTRTYQNNIMGGVFTRFYFSKNRNNDFGTYLDIGAYYSWVAGYGIIDKKNDENERVFVRTKKPSYLHNRNYGVYMRMGYNQFALFARYNMTDIFNDDSFDITPLSIGLQMNLVLF
jgi:hypothetical protein